MKIIFAYLAKLFGAAVVGAGANYGVNPTWESAAAGAITAVVAFLVPKPVTPDVTVKEGK